MSELGFVGLGTMGGPMATHLVDAGHAVTGFDLDEAAVERFADAGGTPAGAVEDVAAGAEVVFFSLPTPEAVTATVEDIEADLETGTILVDLTTSTPATTTEVAGQLADRDVDVLGAPVSGGKGGAEAGELAVMVGGDPAVYQAVRPLLDAFSTNVFHVGDQPGQGHAVKLLNNYLSFMALYATSEAVVLGEQVGLDPDTMCEVFSAGSGRNSATEDKIPNHVLTDGYDKGFALGLMEKDISLLHSFSEEANTPLAFAGLLRQFVGFTRNRYGADGDMTRAFDLLEGLMTGRPIDSATE
ncbi:NAD(P)-dependent oxidoreductase [Halobacteriales archaeon Cl-PHB]